MPDPTKSELILANVGTFGDAHPFIAIGHAMSARGHRVSMFSNVEHRAAIEAAGITYIETDAAIDYAGCIGNPNFWDPIKGMGVYWRSMLVPSIAPLYRYLQAQQTMGENIHVVAGPFMLGARLAQLHMGIDLTTAYTAPSMLRTLVAPVHIAHMYWPRYTPRFVLRAVWKVLDHYKLEPMARSKLHQVCEQLGVPLPPPGSIFDRWMHSPKGVALFPDWFAPRKVDYPQGMRYAHFPRYQLDASSDLSSDLKTFLATGSPPIVVTLGTGMLHAGKHFVEVLTALRQTKLRAVFLSKEPGQLPQQSSDSSQFFYCDYAPFSLLLPQCAGIVHHGGIGTSAQALAAGIPQLVQALGHDQFENARCLVALGTGQRLSRDAAQKEILLALQHWINNDQHANALAKAKAAMHSQAAHIQSLCDSLDIN